MKHPSELTFEAPGPGVWRVDGLHTPKPITALKRDTYFQIPRGMKAGFSRYGVLTNGIDLAVLHRFVYLAPAIAIPRPPGDPARARTSFDAMVAADPEIQERFARAEETLATKRWRTDREHWDTVGRPWMLGRILELTDVDPCSLDDAALMLHIEECQHHLGNSVYYHHILNLVPGLPRSLLFYKVVEWTGLPLDEIDPLLVGSSPISAGDEPELRDLVDALEADGGALDDLLGTGASDAAAVLETLQQREDDIGRTCRAFVRMVGYRTVDGWESMNPYILESPELLIEKIRHGMKREYAKLDPAVVERIRSRVPAASQAEFDEVLADARDNSRIRDERDLYCNIPMSGVLRRGVIEAGRRVADRGLISDTEHLTEASAAEIREVLVSGRSDLGAEFADRYLYREQFSIDDIPAEIGSPTLDAAPLDPEWLTGAVKTLTLAMNLQVQQQVATAEEHEARVLKGKGVSPGTYEGTVRVVRDASEINSILKGEVLVTRSTNPAFNVILPRLGALVTEYGGVLSHAAIVSREFGLPGVVGCRKVTQLLKTGDKVRVDGSTGEVTQI